MRLRNRDINVENNVKNLKRIAITKPNSPAAKRKKLNDSKSTSKDSKPTSKDSKPKISDPKPKLVVQKPKFSYDEKHLKDPNAVANFAPDIFQYLQAREPIYRLPGCIKENACEVNRAMVIDWLIDCQEDFGFNHETLYTAIRLFDIYISANPSVETDQLQLIASSSFLIASKVEEYAPVRISKLVKLCANMYTRDDFKAMEREILRTARYDLGFPLAYSFIRRYARVIDADMKLMTLARFYLEVATHYVEWSLESPSKIAAVCLVLALEKSASDLDWIPSLEHYSNYLMADLEELVQKLDDSVSIFKETFPGCQVVISKYSTKDFFEVAKCFMA